MNKGCGNAALFFSNIIELRERKSEKWVSVTVIVGRIILKPAAYYRNISCSYVKNVSIR